MPCTDTSQPHGIPPAPPVRYPIARLANRLLREGIRWPGSLPLRCSRAQPRPCRRTGQGSRQLVRHTGMSARTSTPRWAATLPRTRGSRCSSQLVGLHAIWAYRVAHRIWARPGGPPARPPHLSGRAAATGVEIHPGRDDRAALLHRPRDGRRHRRDRRDRRRRHALPRRHARRPLAGQDQAPPHARKPRDRRRRRQDPRADLGRRRRAGRRELRGRQGRAGWGGRGRHPGSAAPQGRGTHTRGTARPTTPPSGSDLVVRVPRGDRSSHSRGANASADQGAPKHVSARADSGRSAVAMARAVALSSP
jgi:hypothetical protein